MNKTLFQKFSEQNPQLPFSLQFNWWNEMVPFEWDVAIVENQGEVKAIWPYTIRKKYGFTQLGTSEITPYVGPFLLYPEGQKKHRKYSFEKKTLEGLLKQFPSYQGFEQNCHLDFHNHLPLWWKGWQQKSRFTYLIHNLTDLRSVYEGFADNIRREIKKAEKEISVEETSDIRPLIKVMQSTFEFQKKNLPIQDSTLYSYQDYIKKYSCGKIYVAKNPKQETIASLSIIWDNTSAYYILGGSNPENRNSGAMSLLMWKAIQYSSTVVDKFNFEGSMIQGIERFFRGFGGELTSFSQISHSNSGLLKILKAIKK